MEWAEWWVARIVYDILLVAGGFAMGYSRGKATILKVINGKWIAAYDRYREE